MIHLIAHHITHLEKCLLHLGLGINLGSSVQQKPNHDHIPPPGCNVQRSDTVLHRKPDTLTQVHTQEPSVVKESKTAATTVIVYLWGKVDISTSVEQQLSYVQVFVMCSYV